MFDKMGCKACAAKIEKIAFKKQISDIEFIFC
jgi:hypothetical protein